MDVKKLNITGVLSVIDKKHTPDLSQEEN